MNKCAAFSSHLLLMFAIVLFAGKMDALKCYMGHSFIGYAEKECPGGSVCIAKTIKVPDQPTALLIKKCAPSCEMENCQKCSDKDLCNGENYYRELRCHFEVPEEFIKEGDEWLNGVKELVCPKDWKCITATFDDGKTGEKKVKICGPSCDEIRKNSEESVKKNSSEPKLTGCQQCDDDDLCDADPADRNAGSVMAGPLPMLLMMGILFISVMWQLGLSGAGRGNIE